MLNVKKNVSKNVKNHPTIHLQQVTFMTCEINLIKLLFYISVPCTSFMVPDGSILNTIFRL